MRLFCLLLILISISDLMSQIVNIERSRSNREEKGFKTNLFLNASFSQNTKEIFQGGFDLESQFQKNESSLLLLANMVFVRADGNNYLNRGFQHLRYNYSISKSILKLECFVQNQFNEVQKIKNRKLLGTGLRFSIAEKDSFRLYYGLALMHENERTIDDFQSLIFRYSSYLSLYFQLNEGISMNLITYIQPSTSEILSDYRLSSEGQIQFKINKYLQYQLRLNVLKDSDPIAGVPERILGISNGLKIQW
tara:strand:- start:16 stop:765 length:750 start_codon:yes stop_codon:yes gene_type:complete